MVVDGPAGLGEARWGRVGPRWARRGPAGPGGAWRGLSGPGRVFLFAATAPVAHMSDSQVGNSCNVLMNFADPAVVCTFREANNARM